MAAAFTLCDDDDLLTREPNLDQVWPRKDSRGNLKNDWKVQRLEASQRIERHLRARRTTQEPFQLGQLSQRSREDLRECAKLYALFYVFMAADTQGDETGFFARKQRLYLAEADASLDAESTRMDYDSDNSGTIDEADKQQPFPTRFIRG